jgi:uncharacterized LabA/DUF88 family protein
VSKNVAVFVDVANIFYAAKAAGIDIDYVTLLKSATSGRDFVRAYAYTGLDPENENQRQFHAFLARNGYKVISKDIRKYGDGRIKANLDIELVVDMMKTARNLDIAVVVSGDGDFAPAIRAVQEMGVRVEVISFRGNTSSDLIDVADLFTDIAQVARVEKGSARSGRRVAAEGDLSMTEVPEKETEGAPRRRRGSRSRDERIAAEALAAAAAATGNLIVLPGERLSRVGTESDAGMEIEIIEPIEAESEEGEVIAGSNDGRDAELGDAAHRRRRRRGGRGRGRGRRGEEGIVPAGEESAAAAPDEDEEFVEELPPAQPAHQVFGSVWDSQIGVPTAAMNTAGGGAEGEDELEEPEIPEYLLAERRQRGQRPPIHGGRMGRVRSTYQAALDRERYGRGTPAPTFGAPRSPERPPDRARDRGRGGRPPQRGGRPVERFTPREERPPQMEPRSSSEPWSEVPPELEQLLRAELARKAPIAEPRGGMTSPPAAEPRMPDQPTTAEVKPVRRRRPTKADTAQASVETPAATPPAEKAVPPKRAPRARTAKPAAKPAAKPVAAEAPTAVPAAEAKKPVRRRRVAPAAEEG